MKCAAVTLISLAILLLHQGCAPDSPTDSQKRLRQIISDRDEWALRQFVASDHRGLRSGLDSLIRAATAQRLVTSAGDDTDREAPIVWLSKAYERATGIGDFCGRLEWLQSLSAETLKRKVQLDSIAATRSVARSSPGEIDEMESQERLVENYLEIGDTAAAASGLLARAYTYYDADDRAGCLDLAGQSERLCRQWGLGEMLGDVLYLKSKVLSESDGNYFEAMALSYEAFAHFERFGYREKLPLLRLQLGHSLFLLGFTQQAVSQFQSAAAALSVAGDKRLAGFCYYYLAEALYDLGQLDSAVFYIDRAVLLRQQLAADGRSNYLADLGYARSTRGLIYQASDSYHQAASELAAAQRLFEMSGDLRGAVTNKFRRAALLLDLSRYSQSDALFDTVLALADDFQDRLFARHGRALSKYFLGETGTAMALAFECRDSLEFTRDMVLQPDLSVGFLSDKIGVYNLLVRIYLDRYQQTGETAILDSALQVLESSKAQSLRSELSQKRAKQQSRGQIGGAVDTGGVDPQKAIEPSRIQSSLAQSIEDSLRLALVAWARGGRGGPLPRSELSRRETPQPVATGTAAILEYYMSELGAGIFVMLADTLRYLPIEISLDSLESLSREFAAAISRYPQQSCLSSAAMDCGRDLCRTLMPLDWLRERGCDRLTIITSHPLGGLPFAALIMPSNRFVAEQFEISYAPSIALLHELRPQPFRPDQDHALIVGDPILSRAINSRLEHLFCAKLELQPLNFAAAEMEVIRDILGAGRTIELAGVHANESALKSSNLSDIAILHFATHGLVNTVNPPLSTLIMSPESGEGQDGLLTAAEISDLGLAGKGVVLSACQTAAGLQYQGEGVYSIARAFVAGGASYVVATLWNVDDRSTVDLTRTYYNTLMARGSPAAALSEAQRAMINSPRQLHRHPYFWAPFVYFGSNEVD